MSPLFSVFSPIDGAPAPDSLMEPDLLIRFSSGLPPWLPLIGGAALLLFVLVRARLRRPFRTGLPAPAERPSTASHLAALDALDALGRALPAEVVEEDAFYVNLSRVVRRYLRDCFGMGALEMASHEMLAFLAGKGRSAHGRDFLQALLERCDRVKFGKRFGGTVAAREAVALARDFVRVTTPPDRQRTEGGAP